jgi:hypothetical protein
VGAVKGPSRANLGSSSCILVWYLVSG